MSKRLNLNKKDLTVAINQDPPHVFADYINNENKWYLSGGFESNMIIELSKYFNFTFNLKYCYYHWGKLLANNTWDGIIGELNRSRADIGFGALSISYDRAQAVHFSHPHIITSLTFITASPKPKSNPLLVIQPLYHSFWIYLLIILISILFSHQLISAKFTESKKFAFIWFLVSSALKQLFFLRLPRINSLRILIITWLFGCLLLDMSYSGSLYSLMTIPSKTKTINTIKELVKEQTIGSITLYGVEESINYQWLKQKSNSGIIKQIGDLIKPIKSAEFGLKAIMNSTNMAMIGSRSYLTYHSIKFGQNYFYLPHDSSDSTLTIDLRAFAFAKNFEYKKEFNKFIMNLSNGGLIELWRKRELSKIEKSAENGCDKSIEQNKSFEALTTFHLQSAIYLLIIGNLVSIIIICIEILYAFGKLIF